MKPAERTVQFMARVLQDALADATAIYWRRRAQTFLDAAPRLTDYNGRATAAELAERAERCRQAAEVCMQRASLEAPGQPIEADVWAVLTEVAA